MKFLGFPVKGFLGRIYKDFARNGFVNFYGVCEIIIRRCGGEILMRDLHGY